MQLVKITEIIERQIVRSFGLKKKPLSVIEVCSFSEDLNFTYYRSTLHSSQSDFINSQNHFLLKFAFYIMNGELLISSMFPQI